MKNTTRGLQAHIMVTYTSVTARQLAQLYGLVGFGDSADYADEDLLGKLFGPGVFGFFAFNGDRLVMRKR